LVQEGRLLRQLLAVVEGLRLLVLAGRRVRRLVDGEGVQLVRLAVVQEDDACGWDKKEREGVRKGVKGEHEGGGLQRKLHTLEQAKR
jgi:hypothetical protein